MRYLALIYVEESDDPKPGTPESDMIWKAYGAFMESAGKADVMKAGEALEPTSTATTVRVRDGETATTDGPFAETKEVLAGFFIFECKDLDEAISWSARIPGAATGSVEVRPIAEMQI